MTRGILRRDVWEAELGDIYSTKILKKYRLRTSPNRSRNIIQVGDDIFQVPTLTFWLLLYMPPFP